MSQSVLLQMRGFGAGGGVWGVDRQSSHSTLLDVSASPGP